MIQYRVLGAMLALREFTKSDLSEFSGVKPTTVQSVIDRNQDLLEEQSGTEGEAKPRGGQLKRYRLRPGQPEALSTRLEKLYSALRPVVFNRTRMESDFASHYLPVAFAYAAPTTSGKKAAAPLSLSVAFDLLSERYGKAGDLEEKRRLLDLAKLNLDTATKKMETVSGAGVLARRQLQSVRSLYRLVEKQYLLETQTSDLRARFVGSLPADNPAPAKWESKAMPGALRGLSARERDVLRLVAEGMTSKEIAAMLGLGLQTVLTHRKILMKKFGVTDVAGMQQRFPTTQA